MKKIGIFLSGQPETGGGFQYNLAVLHAIASFPKDEYKVVVAYVTPGWLKYIGAYTLNSIRLSPLVFAIRRFWLLFHLPHSQGEMIAKFLWPMVARKLIKEKCDLWIFPCRDELSFQAKIPAITTIHDLMHRYERRFPEVSANGEYERRERHYSKICMFSKAVLVDSEVGKKQVHESYGMPLERIYVLPFVSHPYILKVKDLKEFDSKYNLPKKFIFYPAQFWMHKNHSRLIKAIYILKNEFPDIYLVLVGSKKNGYRKARSLVKKYILEENVKFLGFVPSEDIPSFYRRARAMIMPTFFGPTNIPPLEAFKFGCPTATSNVYGMPDQVGDAALLFDPESVKQIADNIRLLWTDDALCKKLIRNGKKRSKEWGLPQFKKRLIEIIEQIV